MAGEMNWIDPITGETGDGEVYELHAAIAKALGGTIQPFDKYQGPYVLIGSDIRSGSQPYAVAVKLSDPFWPWWDNKETADALAVAAAQSLFN